MKTITTIILALLSISCRDYIEPPVEPSAWNVTVTYTGLVPNRPVTITIIRYNQVEQYIIDAADSVQQQSWSYQIIPGDSIAVWMHTTPGVSWTHTAVSMTGAFREIPYYSAGMTNTPVVMGTVVMPEFNPVYYSEGI